MDNDNLVRLTKTMVDLLKQFRKFIFIICVGFGLAPFSPEPHLWGKIKWIMGGAVGMQPMDWWDFLLHASPFLLLLLSFLPTEKSKKMKEIIQNGTCTIIDVRTPGEFMGGHVANAKNIPLNEIESRIDEIKNLPQPLVLCCASGMRSGQATSILTTKDLECYNGGSWTAVNAMTVK